MPLDDALKLMAREFREQIEAQEAGTDDNVQPDRELQFLLKLLVDGKYLSIPELDRILKYVTDRRDKQLLLERVESAQQQPRTVGGASSAPTETAERPMLVAPLEQEKPSQQELQQRILSMIGQPAPTSPTAVVQQPLAQQGAPTVDSSASTYINFDNPSVQRALDNLIHNGSNLLKTLSTANSTGAFSALVMQQPGNPTPSYGYGDEDSYGGNAPEINSGYGHPQQQQYSQHSQQAPAQQSAAQRLPQGGQGGQGGGMRHPLLGTEVQRPMPPANRPGPAGMARY